MIRIIVRSLVGLSIFFGCNHSEEIWVSGLKVIAESSCTLRRVSCQRKPIAFSIVNEKVCSIFLTQSFESFRLPDEVLFICSIFIVFNVSRCIDPIS